MPPRPAWLDEPCPPWCAGLHADDDHPVDRRHASTTLSIPVIARSPDAPEATSAAEFVTCLHRAVGAPTTWLYLGDGEYQHVEITVESFRLAVATATRLLDPAATGSVTPGAR